MLRATGKEQGVIYAALDFHPAAFGLRPRIPTVGGLPTRLRFACRCAFHVVSLAKEEIA